ncbi:MAG TPA: hypothetical protein VGR73_23035 [Bryobacteraceae bacterium]|nr:hypothetical protein [Bryobacteraceae bacterium]
MPALAIAALALFVIPGESPAIPAFSRQYATSCMTCHIDFPKLNDFGKAFKDAGFKFPQDDENQLKVAPVMLGAEAQKQNFPKSVWPGSIPGMPPIGLRFNTFFQLTGADRNRFSALTPAGSLPQIIPGADFASGFFSIFTAGNFGGDIAFWVDDDISVSGKNSAGGLGDAYLKFVNASRFLKLPKDSLTVRVGQFELDLPVTQARSYDLSPYDIFSQANIGAMNSMVSLQQNVSNQFTFAGAAKGIELSGGHQYGGYHYSVALVDGNSANVDQSANASPYVPSGTGGANGGIGFGSSENFKTLYARASYRFNLERDSESRHAVQAAGATGPRDHTFLNFGSFYLHGRSHQQFAGASSVLPLDEPYYRAGGDFNFNYRNFNMYGVYMFGRDQSLLPVDQNGMLIPLPLGSTSPLPVGFVKSVPASFNGGFVQADYMIHPWVMAIMRWDGVNSTADRINGLALASGTPFFGPLNSTRTRFTPGLQILIHANVKFSFEYQFRPQQTAVVETNATGGLVAVNPFRVNTALFGLEFVY